MVVGQLEIQLLANMARLQSDMDKAKRSVGDAVTKMNQILGTIGIGISVAGFTSLIKSVVDVGDHMNDLRKITGLTIEQLGGLGKLAKLNGTDLDAVAKAVGIMSKNMYAGSTAFDVLGISTKDSSGQLRNAGQVLLEVSDRFSRMQDGATKSAIANQIFGKSGRDLIPLLNEGRSAIEEATEAYRLHSGMSLQAAVASDEFNDILTKLSGRVTAIKTSFVSELLPTLNNIGNAMLATGQSTNQFNFAASVVIPVLKVLAIAAFTVVDTFRGMGREIGARAAQLAAFASMDFKGAKFIGQALAEDNIKARAEYDKFVDTVMNGDKSVQQFTETQKQYLQIEQKLPAAVEKTTRAIREKKELTDAEQLALLRQNESTKETIALAQRVASVTDSVATEQEIYNKKLDELNRLKPYLAVETYNRALNKAQQELKGTAVATRQTTDEVSQLWMQAGRNIQSTLANSIFNFFDDGLKGMLKNTLSTLGRIGSEFLALKAAQNTGLASMFSAGAAAAGGIGGTGTSALSLASAGTSALSLMRGGFGLNSLVGGGLSTIGGSGVLGSFGAGLSGGSQAAAFIGAESATAGAGLSAGLGAGLGAVAGPAMALFAANALAQALAGDKTFRNKFSDTLQKIPVLGIGANIAAALFGHGPLKFRQQSLQGTASSSGFDGDISNVFRAKGGLLVGNKHKTQTEQFSEEQQALFDNTLKGFYGSAHNFAKNLGLSTDLVDNFTREVQIKSEKGKQVTEEAIAEMLKGIGNSLAQNVLPMIDTFRKAGEDSFGTLTRLNTEFVSLQQAAINLGASAQQAKELISGLSIQTRTSYIEAAGGSEEFLKLTSEFNRQFLTQAEQMAPVIDRIETGLKDLGLSSELTKDQFKVLVQNMLAAGDATGLLLLRHKDEFLAVNEYKESLKQTTQVTKEAANAARNFANDTKQEEHQKRINALLESAGNAITAIGQGIDKLFALSKAAEDASRQLSPQTIDQARANIISNLNFDRRGNVRGIGNVNAIDPASIATLANQSSKGFSSSFELARSKANSFALLQLLNTTADREIAGAREAMQVVASERNRLPKFASGGYHRGGLRIVGERGPELESTGPSNITSNADMKKATGNDEVLTELKKMNKILDAVTHGGTSLRTTAAA